MRCMDEAKVAQTMAPVVLAKMGSRCRPTHRSVWVVPMQSVLVLSAMRARTPSSPSFEKVKKSNGSWSMGA